MINPNNPYKLGNPLIFMRQTESRIAELVGADGKVGQVGDSKRIIQTLGKSYLELCDDSGNFQSGDGSGDIAGKIDTVLYRVVQSNVPSETRFNNHYRVPFDKYVEMGKPKQTLVKITTEITGHIPAPTS